MKILVPVDGSEPALDAVRYALRLQREGLEARFVLATVKEPALSYEMYLLPNAKMLERLRDGVDAHALDGAEALFKEARVPFERETDSGDPENTLIEIAGRYGCESIIMGARGLGALRSALIGSVSLAVLYASKVPVTIVKHDPAA